MFLKLDCRIQVTKNGFFSQKKSMNFGWSLGVPRDLGHLRTHPQKDRMNISNYWWLRHTHRIILLGTSNHIARLGPYYTWSKIYTYIYIYILSVSYIESIYIYIVYIQLCWQVYTYVIYHDFIFQISTWWEWLPGSNSTTRVSSERRTGTRGELFVARTSWEHPWFGGFLK